MTVFRHSAPDLRMGFAKQTMSNLSNFIIYWKNETYFITLLTFLFRVKDILSSICDLPFAHFITLSRTSYMNIQICSKKKQISPFVVMIRRFSSVLLLVQLSFIEWCFCQKAIYLFTTILFIVLLLFTAVGTYADSSDACNNSWQ